MIGGLLERRRRRQTTRRVLAWLDECEAAIAVMCAKAGIEPPPPYPRDSAQEDPVVAVQAMSALLRSIEAGLAGGSAAAVFDEHRPVAGSDGSVFV